jgi:hypothetical protein
VFGLAQFDMIKYIHLGLFVGASAELPCPLASFVLVGGRVIK